MKLSDSEYKKLIHLLDTATYPSDVELDTMKVRTPGVHRKIIHASGEYNMTPYSLKNNELKNFLSSLTNQDPNNIITIHKGYYGVGSKTIPHIDKSSFTLVIMIDSDLKEGGDFYLKGQLISDFKLKGEYVYYNGGTDIHEVTEVKDGFREVLVVWWLDESNNIKTII